MQSAAYTIDDKPICNKKKIKQMPVVAIADSLTALEQLEDGRIADGRHINSTQNCRINRLILFYSKRWQHNLLCTATGQAAAATIA